jgi:uncharacterized protein YjiS (DUF1127 family)
MLMANVNAIRFPYSAAGASFRGEETITMATLNIRLPLFTWTRLQPALPPLRAMLRAVTTRRQLAGMDDRMLHDIGISRVDALREAERAPWDLGRRS